MVVASDKQTSFKTDETDLEDFKFLYENINKKFWLKNS